MEIQISCCQGHSSCSRLVREWLNENDSPTGLDSCRHGSNGLFGSIRKGNLGIFHFYLDSLTAQQLVQCCLHETSFGDTLLIFAASLGKVDAARALLHAFLDALASEYNTTDLLLSDFVDYESSRGKIALVEAIHGRHSDMVDFLLSFHAQTRKPSRLHKRTALDWARVTGQTDVVAQINEHNQIRDDMLKLFVAITKHDTDLVGRLTEESI